MRRLRPILLLAVSLIIGVTAWDFVGSREAGISVRLAELEEIPAHLDSQATRWTWSQSTGNRRGVEGSAASFHRTKDTGVFELEEVELRIFRDDAEEFDLVETPKALFHSKEGRIYSEAPVVLTLGVTAGDRTPRQKRTRILSTGVTFDSREGTVSTDRPTEYEFAGGAGRSVGAFYDSVNRYLQMKSEVHLERFPENSSGLPTRVEAAELLYHEREQRVELKGDVSLERGSQRLESADAVVFLEQGSVRRIEASGARGSDQQPDRSLTFQSSWLETIFSADGVLERVSGANPAEITSRSDSSLTTVNSNHIDLHYVASPQTKQSTLREMYARENARIEVRPRPGQESPQDTRRVSADSLHLVMRENGSDIQRVETLAPGEIEILPADTSRPKRVLRANRITAAYAPGNRMEGLQAKGKVSLENGVAAGPPAAGNEAPLRTWSENLTARFAPASGELQSMRQWADFRFERGSRQGQSEEARFFPLEDRLELTASATVWDADSNVAARRIVMNEATGDLTAEGNVATRYQEPPESGSAASESPGGLFSASQPAFATAERMVSLRDQAQVIYEGDVRLWQGKDRIEADKATIQREAGRLSAEGRVVTYLDGNEETSSETAEASEQPTSQMVITAQSMQFDNTNRRAVYRRDIMLQRGDLIIRAEELEGFLAPPDSEASSRLEKAVAKTNVAITQTAPEATATRRAFGEHAVYDPSEESVRLTGAPARVVDESGNESAGLALTYHLRDDRLLVQGGDGDRARSLRRNQP